MLDSRESYAVCAYQDGRDREARRSGVILLCVSLGVRERAEVGNRGGPAVVSLLTTSGSRWDVGAVVVSLMLDQLFCVGVLHIRGSSCFHFPVDFNDCTFNYVHRELLHSR